jgi:hypothetical protein
MAAFNRTNRKCAGSLGAVVHGVTLGYCIVGGGLDSQSLRPAAPAMSQAGKRVARLRIPVADRHAPALEVLPSTNSGRDKPTYSGAPTVIILALVLVLIGFIAKVPVLWSLGILVAVVGVTLMLFGKPGREIGGPKHYP